MSSKHRWLKQNLFLIAGICLPVLVAGMFVLATSIPQMYVENPQYDLLLSIDSAPLNATFDVTYAVQSGKLTANVGYKNGKSFNTRQLFRYHASTGALQAIEIDIPLSVQHALTGQAEGHTRVTEPLPLVEELHQLTLLANPTAPDGYTFRNQYGGSAGLFGELFGLGRHHYSVAIEHDGRILEIPLTTTDSYRYYRNVQFIGWITQ